MIVPAYTYSATPTRWVDGDTVWMTVDLGFRMTTANDFRLFGIDTPERGQPGYAEAALRCRELAPLGVPLVVKTYKNPDKYGRWLVDIYPAGSSVSVSETLLKEGLGVAYYGGTKAVA